MRNRDSSGHSIDPTDFWLDGFLVHRAIGLHFVSKNPAHERTANYIPVSSIINRDEGRGKDSPDRLIAKGDLGLASKPDLVDLDTHEVWEIKTTRGYAIGVLDLRFYLGVLNQFKDPTSDPWREGTSYEPPPEVQGFLRRAKVYPSNNGVITYEPFVSNTTIGAAAGAAAIYKIGSIAASAGMADVEATVASAIVLEAYGF